MLAHVHHLQTPNFYSEDSASSLRKMARHGSPLNHQHATGPQEIQFYSIYSIKLQG